MTYGIEIRNRQGKTVIGEVQNLIERVSFGTVRPKVTDARLSDISYTEQLTLGVGKGDFGYQYNEPIKCNVLFPPGVNQGNILIFARPQFNEAYGPAEDVMPLACWPLSVVITDTHFSFHAPDASIDYYTGARGDYSLAVSNSQNMFVPGRYNTPYSLQQNLIEGYDTVADIPLCEIYYEIWRVDAPASVDQASHGLKLQRFVKQATVPSDVWSSNTRQFQADIIAVDNSVNTATPFTASADGYWEVDDSSLPVLDAALPSMSIKSNGEYLTLMNVTAGLAAFARGGSYAGTESFEAPNAPKTAYFKRFIEWHFGGKNSGRPFVRLVPRLAYNLETEDSSRYPDIRYSNDLGETPSLVIGRTS